MARFISKQKYSFHDGVQEFVIPLNEPVEVPEKIQEHFLFRMALKSGTIIGLADTKKVEVEAKTETKTGTNAGTKAKG